MVGKLPKNVGEAAKEVGEGAKRLGRSPAAAGFAKLGTMIGIVGGVGTAVAGAELVSDLRQGRTVDAIGHGSQVVAGGFDLAAMASTAGGGAAAGTTLATSVAAAPVVVVGGAVATGFAVGWTVGGMINDHLSADTQHAIGGTVNEIVNEGGWKLLFTHPFGIGM
ncbi:hypothetical protein JNW88_05305 [Micromonospora sp. ATA32]|nr:hypothetical protein [Micromonospora sp. ATA32]